LLGFIRVPGLDWVFQNPTTSLFTLKKLHTETSLQIRKTSPADGKTVHKARVRDLCTSVPFVGFRPLATMGEDELIASIIFVVPEVT